jgi:hypothetical protein
LIKIEGSIDLHLAEQTRLLLRHPRWFTGQAFLAELRMLRLFASSERQRGYLHHAKSLLSTHLVYDTMKSFFDHTWSMRVIKDGWRTARIEAIIGEARHLVSIAQVEVKREPFMKATKAARDEILGP